MTVKDILSGMYQPETARLDALADYCTRHRDPAVAEFRELLQRAHGEDQRSLRGVIARLNFRLKLAARNASQVERYSGTDEAVARLGEDLRKRRAQGHQTIAETEALEREAATLEEEKARLTARAAVLEETERRARSLHESATNLEERL